MWFHWLEKLDVVFVKLLHDLNNRQVMTQTSHTHPAPDAKRSKALMQEKY